MCITIHFEGNDNVYKIKEDNYNNDNHKKIGEPSTFYQIWNVVGILESDVELNPKTEVNKERNTIKKA